MKKLLTTTALVAFAALPVFAQDTIDAAAANSVEAAAETSASAETSGLFRSGTDYSRSTGEEPIGGQDIIASDLMGARVYAMAEAPEDDMSGVTDSMNDIGEVSDILLTQDGTVDAIVLDIGGFLGMGEHRVAMSLDQMEFANDPDVDGEFFLVVQATRTELEASPEFDVASVRGFEAETTQSEPMMAGNDTASPATTGTAEAAEAELKRAGEAAEQTAEAAAQELEQTAKAAAEQADETAEAVAAKTKEAAEYVAAEAASMAENAEAEIEEQVAETQETAPTIEQQGWSSASASDLSAEELTGTTLFDMNDEMIGEVSSLILDDNGKITEAVLDVGGFLGIGEHSVALGVDRLNIQRADETGELRVYVNATEDELESMPEYEKEG